MYHLKIRIMSSGKVLLGILAGAAAGALLGILFAPEKGSVTRKKILTKGEDYADELKEKFGEFVDKVADTYESTVESVKKKVKKEPAATAAE
jgi:gas vesicle protein